MRHLLLLLAFAIASPALAIRQPDSHLTLPAPPPALAQLIGETGDQSATWKPIANATNDATWNALLHSKSGAISIAYGRPLPFAVSLDKAELSVAAIEFVTANSQKLNLSGCIPIVRDVSKALRLISVTLGFTIDGKEVEGAEVVLTVNQKFELMSVKASGFGSRTSGSFSIPLSDAESRATSSLDEKSEVVRSESVYLPSQVTDGIILQVAYRIMLKTENPALQPTLYVSADDGSILAAENRVEFVDLNGTMSGSYYPLYGRQNLEETEFPEESVHIDQDSTYGNVHGLFHFDLNPGDSPYDLAAHLTGRWADVHQFIFDDGRISTQFENGEEPLDMAVVWSDSNSRADERNLYVQINKIHAYYTTLQPDLDGIDTPIPAFAGMGGPPYDNLGYTDNAFFGVGPYGLGLYFGRGIQWDNLAKYADVVYHEYGHFVTANVYLNANLPGNGQGGALNEGWSDYFTCSYTNEPLIGEGGLISANGYMRNLDNNLIFPRDTTGEIHDDSRIISAAMWHTRQILGGSYSDSLFHFARYLHPTDFRGYFLDVLATDDDNGDLTDGTPHYRAIYDQFARHGIGLGDMPYYKIVSVSTSDDNTGGASGNDNGIAEPGETFGVDVSFFRLGAPAANANPVHVTLYSTSPYLQADQWDVSVGDVKVGDRAQTTERLLTRVSEDAQVSFAQLIISVSAGGNDHADYDTIRINIGVPPLLLVRDGQNGYDRSSSFHRSLDSLNLIYADLWTAHPFRSLRSTISLFPTLLWFTGDDSSGILDSDAVSVLTDFLDRGGRLLMTGQYAAKNLISRDFVENRLGVRFLNDTLVYNYAAGIAGDPVGDGLKVLLIGGESAGNQTGPAAIEPVGDAVPCFIWSQAAGTPVAAVRREDPDTHSRSVFFAFGLEGVGGAGSGIHRTNKRSAVLQPALDWLQNVQDVKDQIVQPQRFSLEPAYPNPFNGRTIIRWQLPVAGRANLKVYDLAGREVETLATGNHSAGSHQVVWNGDSYAAGIYVVRMEAKGFSKSIKLALVK